MSEAVKSTDHEAIKRWAEERGGRPSVVRTKQGKGGILRFDFGEKEDNLEEIEWKEFFEIFEESELALLAQVETAEGKTSRFAKFVRRDS